MFYITLIVVSVCLMWSTSGMLFGVKRNNEEKRSMVKVFTIPDSTPTPKTWKNWWCRDRTCGNIDYCTSQVRSSDSCCPMCGCTNQVGRKVDVGRSFRIESKDGSCRQCKCVRTYVGKFSVCRKIAACRDVSTCKRKFKPPGSCCFVCFDQDAAGTKPKLAFPDIPGMK